MRDTKVRTNFCSGDNSCLREGALLFTNAMVCQKIVKIAYGRICTLSHIASLVNKKINLSWQ